jgi:hypothetical protein
MFIAYGIPKTSSSSGAACAIIIPVPIIEIVPRPNIHLNLKIPKHKRGQVAKDAKISSFLKFSQCQQTTVFSASTQPHGKKFSQKSLLTSILIYREAFYPQP